MIRIDALELIGNIIWADHSGKGIKLNNEDISRWVEGVKSALPEAVYVEDDYDSLRKASCYFDGVCISGNDKEYILYQRPGAYKPDIDAVNGAFPFMEKNIIETISKYFWLGSGKTFVEWSLEQKRSNSSKKQLGD